MVGESISLVVGKRTAGSADRGRYPAQAQVTASAQRQVTRSVRIASPTNHPFIPPQLPQDRPDDPVEQCCGILKDSRNRSRMVIEARSSGRYE